MASLVVALAGCQKPECPPDGALAVTPSAVAASGSGAPSATPKSGSPPDKPFERKPFKSLNPKIAPVDPPESLLWPWRAFVNQQSPRQKKNPVWVGLPAKDNVHLEMPEDVGFQCIVTPVEIVPLSDEDEMALEGWLLRRLLRCSNDGWSSWTESGHTSRVDLEGARSSRIDQAEHLIRERMPDGRVRYTTVLLRSDPIPDGKATTGPPKVIDHPVDDD